MLDSAIVLDVWATGRETDRSFQLAVCWGSREGCVAKGLVMGNAILRLGVLCRIFAF
jgi:hypothetical protein